MNERSKPEKAQSEWKCYQTDVSAFLGSLGFSAETDEKLQGARGEHDIDVTARIYIASIPQLWIIEYKRWGRPVPKERVLTLIGIVNDIGADRGLMFAESGFQAGAVRAAANTNITLTSLSDFQDNAAGELLSLQAKVLDERAAVLFQKFMAVYDLDEAIRERTQARIANVGIPQIFSGALDISTITARISQLRQSLEDARFDRWPVAYYALDNNGLEIMDIAHWDGLLFVATETIATCENIYDYMMDTDGVTKSLRDLQTPALTELLASVRSSNK